MLFAGLDVERGCTYIKPLDAVYAHGREYGGAASFARLPINLPSVYRRFFAATSALYFSVEVWRPALVLAV
jgi:hypothetical protein